MNADPRDNPADDEGMMEINPDDILEEIDLGDDPPPEDDVTDDMEDMNLADGEDDVDGAQAACARDDADIVFTKHTGSVFCVNVDTQNGSLAVSGGEDDKAYVWKTNDGEQVLECLGHKDSVICACFSKDSSFVATGDMGGMIKVWKIDTGKEIWSFEVSDLEWLEWHPAAPVLLAGTSDGDFWMWKIPSGDCRTFQGHGSSCCVGRILPDGKKAIIGYDDGAVKLWDLKTGDAVHTFSGHNGHGGSVTAIDCHQDSNLIITGSTDVTSKLIGAANGKVLTTFICGTREDEGDSVEAVGFCKVQNLVATGTLKGSMRIWDVPTQVQRHRCQHEAGIVRLQWDPAAPVVYTCTLDGLVHMWDARTGRREAQWSGHSAEILDMALSRDGSSLVTASGDHTARLFSLQRPDR